LRQLIIDNRSRYAFDAYASPGDANLEKISTIGVVGCGLMGSEIAQLIAQAGYTTLIYDAREEAMTQAHDRIRQNLSRELERKLLGQTDVDMILSRLQPVSSLAAFSSCDIVIEAIVEKMAEKKALFAQLDTICPPGTLFASNTSALSITEMSLATRRRALFGGFHFHNPALRMRLVEVIVGLFSSPETIQTLIELGQALGKQAEIVKDTPGFIVNRLLIPYILDGISLLEKGLADRDTIDNCIQLGCNHPMGPLMLADFMGLDTVYYTALTLYEAAPEDRFRPPRLLERMVNAGIYGMKNGNGFYNYAHPQNASDQRARVQLNVAKLFR
jgi:3-hydroxybutyryl-CoA dehydrogenase